MTAIGNSEDFGKAIREARVDRKLRQEDVALASGVGLRFVHDLERGKSTIQLERALRVAQAVGLEVRLDVRTRS